MVARSAIKPVTARTLSVERMIDLPHGPIIDLTVTEGKRRDEYRLRCSPGVIEWSHRHDETRCYRVAAGRCDCPAKRFRPAAVCRHEAGSATLEVMGVL